MKRTLAVFKVKHNGVMGTVNKPELLCSIQVEPDAKSVLGARDVISLAYAGLLECDELRVVREEYAIRRGWIEKPLLHAPKSAQGGAAGRKSGPPVKRREGNPFDL